MAYYPPQAAPYYPTSAPPLATDPLASAPPGPTLRPATWAPPPPISQQHSQVDAPVEAMLFDAAPCPLSCCAPTEPLQIVTAPVCNVSYSLAGGLTYVNAPAARAKLPLPLYGVPPLWSGAEPRSPSSGTSVAMQDVPSSSVESFEPKTSICSARISLSPSPVHVQDAPSSLIECFYAPETSSCGTRFSLSPSPVHVQDAPSSLLEYFYAPETSSRDTRFSLSPSPVHVHDAPSDDFYEPEMSSCSSLTPSPPPLPLVASVMKDPPHISLCVSGVPSVRGGANSKGRSRRDKSRTCGLILTGDNAYVCDFCGVAFIRKHDGERHLRSHTGERPFPCHGGCGKAFRRADARSRHWGVYRECEWRHTTFLEGTPEGARRARRLLRRVKRAELVSQGIARPEIERILKKM